MKNREKYREEIVKAIKDGDSCDFMIKTVNPLYSDGWACNDELCQLFAFWLDEEYTEPPKPEVDWNKVPVDTLVRVQYDKSNKWFLRYFKKYEHGAVAPYVTWVSGTTSATSGGLEEHWQYCELVEDEDDGSN